MKENHFAKVLFLLLRPSAFASFFHVALRRSDDIPPRVQKRNSRHARAGARSRIKDSAGNGVVGTGVASYISNRSVIFMRRLPRALSTSFTARRPSSSRGFVAPRNRNFKSKLSEELTAVYGVSCLLRYYVHFFHRHGWLRTKPFDRPENLSTDAFLRFARTYH